MKSRIIAVFWSPCNTDAGSRGCHCNPRHPIALLRPRRKGQPCLTINKRHELAPLPGRHRGSECGGVTVQTRHLEDVGGPVGRNIFGGRRCPLGVKTGKARYEHMFSALPLKADITLRTRYVRFVPQLDSCTAAKGFLIQSPCRRRRAATGKIRALDECV
jgi:hypothetical protein